MHQKEVVRLRLKWVYVKNYSFIVYSLKNTRQFYFPFVNHKNQHIKNLLSILMKFRVQDIFGKLVK